MKGASSCMAYIQSIWAEHYGWFPYAVSLLAGVAPGVLLAFQRRGFGRGGSSRRSGSFGGLRILFVLLFTTILGPIVLVALLAFVGYRFYATRRGR